MPTDNIQIVPSYTAWKVRRMSFRAEEIIDGWLGERDLGYAGVPWRYVEVEQVEAQRNQARKDRGLLLPHHICFSDENQTSKYGILKNG